MNNMYDPVDQTGVTIDGLDIGKVVEEIRTQGYTVVDSFLTPDNVQTLRDAFNTEVPITVSRSLGTSSGRTWRAHNLLAKKPAHTLVF